ncbi:hypothetical protein LACDD01_02067 [Lactococcus sp. DD01]|nr:hypothetical protein LACDD01_02067 [Lactococcus sp. DD01]
MISFLKEINEPLEYYGNILMKKRKEDTKNRELVYQTPK